MTNTKRTLRKLFEDHQMVVTDQYLEFAARQVSIAAADDRSTTQIIQLCSHPEFGLFALTKDGQIFSSAMLGVWEKVNLPK